MPGRSPRNKGFAYEREVVHDFQDMGFKAKRAVGSDGRAFGKKADVDVLVEEELCFQLKRKKSLPNWLSLPAHMEGVIYRPDYGISFIQIPLYRYLELLRKERLHK